MLADGQDTNRCFRPFSDIRTVPQCLLVRVMLLSLVLLRGVCLDDRRNNWTGLTHVGKVSRRIRGCLGEG